jgi:multiple sugar transport system permease protein
MIGVFRSLFIIPMMITPAVTALMWVQLWHTRYGAINALLAGVGISAVNWLGNPGTALFAIIISDVWQWTPFVCLIVVAGFQSLPTEVFEASVVDGVNAAQQFFLITLPLLMPFLGTAILFRIVYSLRVYELAWIQTWGGPGNSTELMSIRVAIKAFTDLKIGQSSALSILLLIVVTILTTVLYRLVFSPRQR